MDKNPIGLDAERGGSELEGASKSSLIRRLLTALWAGWKRIASGIAVVQTFILLLLIFVLVVGPIALLMRLLRQSPLTVNKAAGSFWVLRQRTRESLEDCARQF